MVALKAAQVQSFIANPNLKYKAILVYGTDAGLVSERAKQLSLHLATKSQSKAEIVRIDDTDLEEQPDRLHVELQTLSMFSERKVVRVSLGRRVTGVLIKSILDTASKLETALIVEGGNLKPSDTARKAFEAAASAVALPCFSDTQQDLSILIDETINHEKLSIARDAKQLLLDRLGADRAQSRSEIAKLLLFVGDRKEIKSEDILTIVGDTSSVAVDTVISHTSNGDVKKATEELTRSVNAGENPQMIMSAIQRHFRRLHRVRNALDAGQSFDAAARTLRPPLFFKQKDAMAAQCRRWTSNQLSTALSRIYETIKSARYNTSLEYELAERLVLELATMAARKS